MKIVFILFFCRAALQFFQCATSNVRMLQRVLLKVEEAAKQAQTTNHVKIFAHYRACKHARNGIDHKRHQRVSDVRR